MSLNYIGNEKRNYIRITIEYMKRLRENIIKQKLDQVSIKDQNIVLIDIIDNLLNKLEKESTNFNYKYYINKFENIKNYINRSGNTELIETLDEIINGIPHLFSIIGYFQKELFDVMTEVRKSRDNIDYRKNFLVKGGCLTEIGFNNNIDYYLNLINEQNKGSLGYIFLDSDDLKGVNDSCGHSFGQEFIFETGRVFIYLIKEFQDKYPNIKFFISNLKKGDEWGIGIFGANKQIIMEFIDNIDQYLKNNLIDVKIKDDQGHILKNKKFGASFCAGISYIHGKHQLTGKTIFDIADYELNKMKQRKKDQQKRNQQKKDQQKRDQGCIHSFKNIKLIKNLENYDPNNTRKIKKLTQNKLLLKTLEQLIELREELIFKLEKSRTNNEKAINRYNLELTNLIIPLKRHDDYIKDINEKEKKTISDIDILEINTMKKAKISKETGDITMKLKDFKYYKEGIINSIKTRNNETKKKYSK